MDTQSRSETVIEKTEETVTVETEEIVEEEVIEMQCPNCEQYVEEIIPLTVGHRMTSGIRVHTGLCQHCADSVFDPDIGERDTVPYDELDDEIDGEIPFIKRGTATDAALRTSLATIGMSTVAMLALEPIVPEFGTADIGVVLLCVGIIGFLTIFATIDRFSPDPLPSPEPDAEEDE